jgi:uncharacterized protein (UPF0218 family)
LLLSGIMLSALGTADINSNAKDINNDDQITSFAREFINKNIVHYESNPKVNIIDSKITRLELIESFDNLADAPIDVYALELFILAAYWLCPGIRR